MEGRNKEYHVLQGLKGFVSEASLVNPLNGTVLCFQIHVCRSFVEHGGNLALDSGSLGSRMISLRSL